MAMKALKNTERYELDGEFPLRMKCRSVASQITWQYQGLKFPLLQVSFWIAPLLNLLLTRRMIQYQHLRLKEVHCSIHRWDMDWRVLILHLEMDWQAVMVCFLLIMHRYMTSHAMHVLPHDEVHIKEALTSC
jgi:hypothetical protein